jgi:hypothetical protein
MSVENKKTLVNTYVYKGFVVVPPVPKPIYYNIDYQ